jgi:poly(3-hydroxybutyrate) depolymerase
VECYHLVVWLRIIVWALFATNVMGCSKRHSENSPKDRQLAPSAAPANASACTPNAGEAASHYVSIDVAGKRRRFYLVPPAGSGKAVDLVVGFHGRGRSGEHVAQNWNLGREASRPYVGIYPDGSNQKWFHDLFGWDTRSEVSPELAFYDALVDWSVANYCIDRSRIHVLGHSWGAGMANLVACARKGVKTLVSVGGGGPTFPCQAPVATMIVHGVSDEDEPLSLGQLAVTTWSFYNRCGTSQSPAQVEGCVQFSDCLKESPLLWCEHPGGHGWPDILRDGRLLKWLQRPG